VRLVYRPIERWPGAFTSPRREAPFEATWKTTQELLERELRALDVAEAVLQVDSPNERDFRLDGALRSDAKLRTPAVILSFETRRYGKLSYPCDTFTKRSYRGSLEGWQANVRAIGLGLEALRKVDRYGIANTGQQYTGWKAIGAGVPLPSSAMTVDQAARFLATHADLPLFEFQDLPGEIIANRDTRAVAFRTAARKLHPDSPTGNEDDFKRLNEAMEVLKKHVH
jgi:hypothetical protein